MTLTNTTKVEMPIYSPHPIRTLDTSPASLACSVPKLHTSKSLPKMAAWPWRLQSRSRCQSTYRTQFTHTTMVWNFVLWNEFSVKFCALKWFQSEIQSEILCSKMISAWNSIWNFVFWNKFDLKFCALKWCQSEILCSEIISVWNSVVWNDFILNFVLWNAFRLKICAWKWTQSEFCALKWIHSKILCSEFFALNWNFLSLSAIVYLSIVTDCHLSRKEHVNSAKDMIINGYALLKNVFN